MAKTKKNNRWLFSDYSDFTIFVVVLLIVTLGVITWLFAGLTSEVSKHKSLENLSNQACLGISIADDSGFNIDTSTLYATSSLVDGSEQQITANQNCSVAGTTDEEKIHGKKIDSYNFGAEVKYFETKEATKAYADSVTNRQRSWSPDDTYTSFTFLVTHIEEPYFDAYSVKGNALLRISLPCPEKSKSTQALKNCQLQADRTISVFNKQLSLLTF